MINKKTYFGCSWLVLAALGSVQAHAQTASPAAEQDASEQTAAAAKASGRNDDDEIVVTAQKRVENALDIPSSISVVGGERLENLHATTVADYAAYVPGFNVSTGGGAGRVSMSLRGISSIGGGVTVGTYLDETPVGSSAAFARADSLALDLLPYDIERIEILRGPQGTLYGAGTIGGLLKYVSRAPDLNDVEIRGGGELLTIKGADDPGYGLRAGVNVPLIRDKLAIRLGYYRQKTPGFVDNLITGEEDENEVFQEGGRASLLWEPTNDLSIRLSAMTMLTRSDDNGTVANTIISPPQGDSDPILFEPVGGLVTAHALAEPFRKRFNHFDATIDWDLGGISVVSSTGYERTKTSQIIDVTPDYENGIPLLSGFALPPGFVPFILGLDFEKWTQEVRLVSPAGGMFEWMVGLYYTEENSDNRQTLGAFSAPNTPYPSSILAISPFDGLNIPHPVTGAPQPLNPLADGTIATKYKEIAGFANVTLRLSKQFEVTGGLRVARNTQDFLQTAVGPFFGLFGTPFEVPGGSKETVVTYMISPSFHINDTTMVYARLATGYRPGGPNILIQPGPPTQFDSDTVTNYEIGFKSEFLNRRAVVELAAYQVDWKDIQISSSQDGVGFTGNAGTARIRGFEASAVLRPVDGLRLGATLSHTDGELRKVDADADVGLPGDELPDTPRWNASFTADYVFQVGSLEARVGGGYRYVGSRLTDLSRTTTNPTPLPSYEVVDLNASISNGERWKLSLFAKNLLDERAVTDIDAHSEAFFTGEVVRVNSHILQPRTIGISLDVGF